MCFNLSYYFLICLYSVSQGESFEISTPRCIYWSTIGKSSPHVLLKFTGFTSSALHTTTAHFLTFAVTLHFPVYSGASLRIYYSNPSDASAIRAKSFANFNLDTIYSHRNSLLCYFECYNQFVPIYTRYNIYKRVHKVYAAAV